MERKRLGALAGLAAPLIFVGVFLVEGFLRPGYDQVSMFVSELSLGPRGWIQITSFILTGILYLIFAWGLAAQFTSGKASRFGPLLFALIGLAYFVSGPAVMDPTSTPLNQVSVHGLVHSLTGALVFVLMPVSAIVFYRRFNTDPAWLSMKLPTIVAIILMLVGLILLRIASLPTSNVLTAWDGLLQRLLLIPFHAWVFLFALKLRQISH